MTRSATTSVVGTCSLALALAAGCRRVDDDAPPAAGARVVTTPDERIEGVRPAASHSTIVVPDFGAVASRVGPSVVTVIATVRQPEGDTKSKIVRGVGSGMIVDAAAGHVLTNEHVVAAASRVEVELADRERVTAQVVFADDMLDLALLQQIGRAHV